MQYHFRYFYFDDYLKNYSGLLRQVVAPKVFIKIPSKTACFRN